MNLNIYIINWTIKLKRKWLVNTNDQLLIYIIQLLMKKYFNLEQMEKCLIEENLIKRTQLRMLNKNYRILWVNLLYLILILF
jgi:hypothetical protein